MFTKDYFGYIKQGLEVFKQKEKVMRKKAAPKLTIKMFRGCIVRIAGVEGVYRRDENLYGSDYQFSWYKADTPEAFKLLPDVEQFELEKLFQLAIKDTVPATCKKANSRKKAGGELYDCSN